MHFFLSHARARVHTVHMPCMIQTPPLSTDLTFQQSEDNGSLGSFALAKQAHTFLPSGTQRYSLYYQK